MLAVLLCPGSWLYAQQQDVTFFVIGKHANFMHVDGGTVQPVDYSFFSEIFLTSNGHAESASLVFPTGERVAFRDMRLAEDESRDNVLLISGEDRFTDFAGLQARYPDGDYRVSFETPSGSVRDGTLVFEERPLPDPPRISIQQPGDAACVAAGVDLEVGWSRFHQGRADANGILDDLVFVILSDESGARVAHSGRPFSGGPYLTFADEHFTVAGDVLKAAADYVLQVEHAILDDTTRFDGVPAFTTRAVTTKLEFTTCPDSPDDDR